MIEVMLSSRPKVMLAPLAGVSVDLVPGVLLCLLITAIGTGIQTVEIWLAGRAWLETLVIAILLGAAVRTAWTPGARWKAGIAFSGKLLLEVAVVLLGATISAGMIAGAGVALLAAIMAIVF
jgi:uncharacterized membrane protein YadS